MTSIVDMSLGISSGPRAVMEFLALRPEVGGVTIQTRPYFYGGLNGFIISMNPSEDGSIPSWINVAVTESAEGHILGHKLESAFPYFAGISWEYLINASQADIDVGVPRAANLGAMGKWVEKQLHYFYAKIN